MHTSGQYQVVQIPRLQDAELCPMIALRTMLKYLGNLSPEALLFQVKAKNGLGVLTAPKAFSFF